MSLGKALVDQLQQHVLDVMRGTPACALGEHGLGNNELEELCGLSLHLESQDHYLTYSILQSLVAAGKIEQIRWPQAPTRPKYRLR